MLFWLQLSQVAAVSLSCNQNLIEDNRLAMSSSFALCADRS